MKNVFSRMTTLQTLLFFCVVASSFVILCSASCDPPCANGGKCVDDKCQCTLGFEGKNCLNRTCAHAELDPTTGECKCNNGWIGVNCLVCSNDQACSSAMPLRSQRTMMNNRNLKQASSCSTDNIVQHQKHFSCKLLGTWSQYLGQNLTWSCSSEDKECHLQTWMPYESKLQELFYCDFTQCDMSQEDQKVMYKCQQSNCALTDFIPTSDFVKRIIDMIKHSGSLSCSASGSQCSFQHSDFPLGVIDLECSGGECI